MAYESLLSDLQQLLSDQEGPPSRWNSLGSDSWPRFVVHTRSSIWARNPQLHLLSLDWIYVEWLKRLAGKQFSKVCTLLSNVHQLVGSLCRMTSEMEHDLHELRERPELQDLLSRLCGPKMRDGAAWWLSRCIQVHIEMCVALLNELSNSPPLLLWVMPAVWRQARLWPLEAYLRARWGVRLSKVVGCEVQELGWWHVDPASTPVQPPPQGPSEHLIQPWLQTYGLRAREEEEFNGNLWGLNEEVKVKIWNLLDVATPPIWARKFYRGRLADLTANFTNFEDLKICSWVANWMDAFDLAFMDVVQKLVLEGEANIPVPGQELSCSQRIDQFLKAIWTLRSMPSTPRTEHCETHPDFLVEPTLLLQLPWHPAVLQPWLAAALLEITRFEYHSMELRHLPLPPTLAPLASRLLSLVCRCKERVLLGVILLCRDVNTFPTVNQDTPELLMDQAILPAVPVLRFLVRREADSLLAEIKHRAAWPCEEVTSPLVGVPLSAYTPHPALVRLASRHFFHARYWLDSYPGPPYPISDLTMSDLLAELAREPDLTPVVYTLTDWTLEEKLCAATKEGLPPLPDLPGENFSTENFASAMENFNQLKQLLSEGLPPFSVSSLQGSLVRLSALSLIRQQTVRSLALDAQMYKRLDPMLLTSLHLPALPASDPTSDLSRWESRLAHVTSQMSTLRKTWFHEQFPAEWTRPIDIKDSTRQEQLLTTTDFDGLVTIVDAFMGHIFFHSYVQIYELYAQHKLSKPVVKIYNYQCLLSSFLRFEYVLAGLVPCSPESHLCRTYVDSVLFGQLLPLSKTLKEIKPFTKEDLDMRMLNVARAYVAAAPLRYEGMLATFRVLARKCTVEEVSEPFLESLMDWVCCFPEPRHEMHLLVIRAGQRTFRREWINMDLACHLTIGLPYPRKLQPLVMGPLERLYLAQGSILTLLNMCLMATLLHPGDEMFRMNLEVVLALRAALQPRFTAILSRFLYNLNIAVVHTDYVVPPEMEITQAFLKDTRELFGKALGLLQMVRFNLQGSALTTADSVDNEGRIYHEVVELFLKPGGMKDLAKMLMLKVPLVEDGHRFKHDINKLLKEFIGDILPFSLKPGRKRRERKPITSQQPGPKKEPNLPVVAPKPPPTVAVPASHTQREQSSVEESPSCSNSCEPSTDKSLWEGAWALENAVEASILHDSGDVECLGCHRAKQPGEKFRKCKLCVKDRTYPDPAWFCSEACQEATFKEHQENHLEFELGLTCWGSHSPTH